MLATHKEQRTRVYCRNLLLGLLLGVVALKYIAVDPGLELDISGQLLCSSTRLDCFSSLLEE